MCSNSVFTEWCNSTWSNMGTGTTVGTSGLIYISLKFKWAHLLVCFAVLYFREMNQLKGSEICWHIRYKAVSWSILRCSKRKFSTRSMNYLRVAFRNVIWIKLFCRISYTVQPQTCTPFSDPDRKQKFASVFFFLCRKDAGVNSTSKTNYSRRIFRYHVTT